MIDLFDTHCHIQSCDRSPQGEESTRHMWEKAGNPSGESLLAGAQAAGVTRFMCVGCTLEDSRLAIEFAEQHDRCGASIGLHPHEAQHYAGKPELLKQFSDLAAQPQVQAVGECGLDYYYTHSPREAQIEVLKFQIELAREHNLPMIFHVRESFDDFWPIFESYSGIRGVLHSFTDSRTNLDRALKHGLYIGVNGIMTFAKDPAQLDMYASIPLQNLLLETDAPFLTPTPYRGTICEPKHVRVVAECASKLRGENLDQIAAATTTNARKLFGNNGY